MYTSFVSRIARWQRRSDHSPEIWSGAAQLDTVDVTKELSSDGCFLCHNGCFIGTSQQLLSKIIPWLYFWEQFYALQKAQRRRKYKRCEKYADLRPDKSKWPFDGSHHPAGSFYAQLLATSCDDAIKNKTPKGHHFCRKNGSCYWLWLV